MLHPFEIYAQYFLPLLALQIAFIAVGGAALFFYNKNLRLSLEHLFQSSLLGSIIVTSLYALCKTNMQSVSCGFIVLAGLAVLYRKKIIADEGESHKTPINIKYAVPLFFVLLVLSYTLFFVLLYDFDLNAFKPSFIDDYFYAALTRSMVDNGAENLTYALNYFEKNSSTNFYHYYELWLAGIVYELFDLNAYLALRLVVLPFLIFNFLLGLIAISEHIFPQSNQIKLYLLALLGFGVIEFQSPIPNLPIVQYYHDEIIFGISPFKQCVVLVFALVFCLSLYKKQHQKALFWLLCLPIISFTTFPFVVGGALMLFYGSLIVSFFTKQKTYLHSASFYLPLHLVPIGIVLFYMFTQREIVGGIVLNAPFEVSAAISFLTTTTINLLKYNISPYFPFIFLVGMLYKYDKTQGLTRFRTLFLFVFCCGIAGLLAASLSYRNLNALQVLRMPFMSFMRLFFVFVAIHGAHQFFIIKNIWYRGSVILAGIFALSNLFSLPQYAVIGKNTIDAQFKNEVDTAFIRAASRNTGDMLVTLRDTAEVKPAFWYLSWHTHRFTVLDAYERNTLCLNITDIDGLVSENKQIPNRFFTEPSVFNFYSNLQQQNPFVRFIQTQKTHQQFSSVAQSQIDFMRKHNVKRIMVSGKYEPSALLQPYIQHVITEKNNLYEMLIVSF